MNIKKVLSGGDPRSLGRTDKIIETVLKNQKKLKELFQCLFSRDQIIRMRASDALEKVCRQKPDWLKPYIDLLLDEVSKIKQSSIQWHLAQIFTEVELTSTQKKQAINILLDNLSNSSDWIVTNLTIESLAKFTRQGDFERSRFVRILQQQKNNQHKSVTSRVTKLLKEF